jgi:hypothetical protein
MADDIARIETADAPPKRPIEQLPPARQELQGRLDRLDDKHPSSPRYETADTGQADADAADADTAEPVRAEPDAAEPARADADAAEPAQPGGGADDGRARGGSDAADDSEDGRRENGWQAPGVRDHPNRPHPDEVHLPTDRAEHILAGDGPDTSGGGHRNGTRLAGKTEFPKEWTDDVIVSTVVDVARNPDSAELQDNGRWLAVGERDGVEVKAVVQPDGRIWTAWPEPGGRGVIENPRK